MRRWLGIVAFASAIAGASPVMAAQARGSVDDRLQIYELMDRYGVVHDLGTAQEYAGLFTADAEISIGSGPAVAKGHDALVAMAERDHKRFGGAVAGDGKTGLIMRHVISNRQVAFAGKDAATGSCYVTTLIRTPDNGLAVLSIGRYEDEYRRKGGQWLIARRRIIIDLGDQKLGKQLGF